MSEVPNVVEMCIPQIFRYFKVRSSVTIRKSSCESKIRQILGSRVMDIMANGWSIASNFTLSSAACWSIMIIKLLLLSSSLLITIYLSSTCPSTLEFCKSALDSLQGVWPCRTWNKLPFLYCFVVSLKFPKILCPFDLIFFKWDLSTRLARWVWEIRLVGAERCLENKWFRLDETLV